MTRGRRFVDRVRGARRRIARRRDEWLFARLSWVDRGEPWWLLGVYLVGLYLLVALPIIGLTIVLQLAPRSGTGASATILLGNGWDMILVELIAATFALSPIVGGLARATFDRFHDRYGMLLAVAGFGALLAYASYITRGATAGEAMSHGGNALVAAVFVTWLFVVGYVCKVPWDRARDLWASDITRGMDRGHRLWKLRLQRRLRTRD